MASQQVPGVEYAERITVVGKDPATYFLPSSVQIECDRECPACSLPAEPVDMEIPQTPMQIARLVGTPDRLLTEEVRAACRLKMRCPIRVVSRKSYSVTAVTIVPDLNSLKSYTGSKQYTIRPAFSTVSLERGTTYEVKLSIGINPKNQMGMAVISEATAVRGTYESFSFEPSAQRALQARFQSCTNQKQTLQCLLGMAKEHAGITGIVGRPELHILTTLVFHSVLEFKLPHRERLIRGWLQALILGDTRCGKGLTVKGMLNWFGVGDIISGENASKMGLLGGVMYDTGRPIAAWGRFPLNDRGLLAIDEFHELHADVVKDLSRMRSEGVAEIDKGGLHEQIPARVRLIMICNTQKRKLMSHYRFGIEAVADTFPNPADLSRIDMVAGATEYDVATAEITGTPRVVATSLSKDVAQQQILWAWSLSPDDIEFTPDAYSCMLKHALPHLAERYASEIPLVLGQEMHEKLGRIACAVAAAVFSTKKGSSRIPTLRVEPHHVMVAVDILDGMYTRPALQYDQYSRLLRSMGEPIDEVAIAALLQKGTGESKIVAAALLSLHETVVNDIQDIVGFPTQAEARTFLARLVAARGYIRRGHGYVKTASFISWLKQEVEKP